MTTRQTGRPPGTVSRRTRSALSGALPPLLLSVVLVGVWWVAADVANSSVFPAPPESMRSLASDLGTEEFRSSVLTSMQSLAVAYSAAVVVGALVGIVVGLSRFWSDAVLPLLYSLNSIPKVIFFPVFLLFLGLGSVSRDAFAFVGGVIPMSVIALEGTASVQRLHLKLAASLQLSYPMVVRKIFLPSMIPALATGARLTFGFTFLGLILAEQFAGTGGLGYELLRNISLVRLGNILGEVIFIAVLALVPTLLLRQLETYVVRRFGA